ncbi:MAG: DUF2256 and DUF3253 domain-containing protein [Desulfobacterales bacterium]|nr:DUF2256 and DUF3253 domain-containing protein [Desulfobacterales bacterium]
MNKPRKICIVCGRDIHWRKKWQNNWHQVKYCSNACRKSGITDSDVKLEEIIINLLDSRKTGATICPSEAARALIGSDDELQWRLMMEPARRAARRLVHEGKIVIMQSGKMVDPSKFKGPIRLKLKS